MMLHLQRELMVELHWHARVVMLILERHPVHRHEIVYGLLGSAIALADLYGADVEGFLASVRENYPRPDVCIPSKEHLS